MNRRTEGFIYLAGFIACIPLANWLIGHVGTVCLAERKAPGRLTAGA